MLNPTKYIRAGIITHFSSEGITAPVWEDGVPKNVNPVPSKYIILSEPTLQPSQQSANCYEWEARINITCNLVNPQGYHSGAPLDDMVEQVINAMTTLVIPNFGRAKTKHIMETMVSSPVDTGTATIQRRIIPYTLWLNRI